MNELELVEQWGSGIPRMTKACLEAGLAEPEFVEAAGRLRVVLRSSKSETRPVNPADDVMKVLARGAARTSDIAAELNSTVTYSMAERAPLLVLYSDRHGRAVYVGALSDRRVAHAISDSAINPKSRRMVEHHFRALIRRRNEFPLVRDGIARTQIARSTIAHEAIRHPQKGA